MPCALRWAARALPQLLKKAFHTLSCYITSQKAESDVRALRVKYKVSHLMKFYLIEM